jgi:hypothetical protein
MRLLLQQLGLVRPSAAFVELLLNMIAWVSAGLAAQWQPCLNVGNCVRQTAARLGSRRLKVISIQQKAEEALP